MQRDFTGQRGTRRRVGREFLANSVSLEVVDTVNFEEQFKRLVTQTKTSTIAAVAPERIEVDLTLDPLQQLKLLEQKLNCSTFGLNHDFRSKLDEEDREESTAQSPSYSKDDDPYGLQKARELEALIINLESYE